MNPITSLARAYNMAAIEHVHQRRKGEAAEPYLNHLTEVAELVAIATRGEDPDLVLAAVLHDVIEDALVPAAKIAREFNERVAALVAAVTDDKSLPKAERKQLQIEHAAALSPDAKALKIADKVSNVRSLVQSPPADWSRQRIADYVAWASEVVDRCRGVSPYLEKQFDAARSAAERQGIDGDDEGTVDELDFGEPPDPTTERVPGSWHLTWSGGAPPAILDQHDNPIASLAPSSKDKMLARASLLMAAPHLYGMVTAALEVFQVLAQKGDKASARAAREIIPYLQDAVDHANFVAPVTLEALVGQ